ncbi:hypothetical protein CMK22_07675 [Candidatus Poribacteria bacterium]|nr:hypothetical protein [Candidatus Poribacteria bacterium]
MIGALYAGLSGLKNHQTKINVIGHNLSNINTIGFKKSRVVFREAFSQTLKAAVAAQGDRGGVNPQSVGTGSQIGSIDVLQRNGSAQTTDMPTDLMFRGKGHFVLEVPAGGTKAQEESSRSIKASSIRAFTRNGNFGIDQSGDLVYRPNGYKVLGWQADPVTGEVNTANPDAISSVSFPFMRSISRKTSFVQFASNLDARAGAVEVVSDGGTGLLSSVTPAQDGGDLRPGSHKVRVERAEGADTFTASLDGGEALAIVDSTVTFSDADGRQLVTLKFGDEIKAGTASLEYISKFHKTEIGIFDGLGQRHDAEITFTKEAVRPDGQVNPAGTWRWNIEDSHITDAKVVTNGDDKVRTGLIQFNNQTASFSTADPAIAYINVQPIDAEGNETGAGELAVKLDFANLTQFADSHNAIAQRQDGVGPGNLVSFSISATGLIDGIFSNGVNKAIAQLAAADIPNAEGLTVLSDTMVTTSPSSGAPAFVTAGTRNMGEITAGALEMSNVDLTEEFTDLITTERGFQANARVITTSDNILTEAMGLKR